jgi:hypothetical protein
MNGTVQTVMSGAELALLASPNGEVRSTATTSSVAFAKGGVTEHENQWTMSDVGEGVVQDKAALRCV